MSRTKAQHAGQSPRFGGAVSRRTAVLRFRGVAAWRPVVDRRHPVALLSVVARRILSALRLRAAVAVLLVMVFGLQAVPLVQAQAKSPECCMAADGKGCSMHLHRAAGTGQTAHAVAALQPQCPCTPIASAAGGAHDAASLSSSKLHFALPAEGSACVQPCSLCDRAAADGSGTRGPPRLKLLA